jgi:transcriptional regulator with XRE-family HTH domain
LRKEKGYTQEEFCKKANISRPTLSKLENGELGNVSIAKFNAILKFLGYELCIERFNPFTKCL